MEIQESLYNKNDYIETASGNKVCRQSVLCGSQNVILNGKTLISDGCVIRGDLANIRIGRFCIIRSKAVIRPPFKKFSKGVAFFPIHIGDHVYVDEETVLNAAAVGSYTHSPWPSSQSTSVFTCTSVKKRCSTQQPWAVTRTVVCAPSHRVQLRQSHFSVAFFPIHIGDHVYVGEETVLNAAAVGSYTHIGANCVIGRRAVLKDCCAVLDGSVLPAETVVPPFAIMSGSPAKIVGRLPPCTQDLMIDATKSFYQKFKPK